MARRATNPIQVGYKWWGKDKFQLRLEFQTPPKGAEFDVGFGWPGGKIAGIQFPVSATRKLGGAAFGLTGQVATIERGGIVSTGKQYSKHVGGANAALAPEGAWNRLDLVRDGDRAAFFVNGRFIIAIVDIRGAADGKEIDLGPVGFAITGRTGETVIRRIEVRDISAFQPELIEPGPGEKLLAAKDLSKWGKIDNGQADAIKFVESEAKPVLALRKVPKSSRHTRAFAGCRIVLTPISAKRVSIWIA